MIPEAVMGWIMKMGARMVEDYGWDGILEDATFYMEGHHAVIYPNQYFRWVDEGEE